MHSCLLHSSRSEEGKGEGEGEGRERGEEGEGRSFDGERYDSCRLCLKVQMFIIIMFPANSPFIKYIIK